MKNRNKRWIAICLRSADVRGINEANRTHYHAVGNPMVSDQSLLEYWRDNPAPEGEDPAKRQRPGKEI